MSRASLPTTPAAASDAVADARAAAIDALLPQTQCRRCGFDGCRPYADAIADNAAPINRCPPGGAETIDALARLLARPVLLLDPELGDPPPRRVARIDNRRCIGCTKCIRACPVDAIIGAPRHQHHVLAERCTGCDLCLAPCPVDCIDMIPLAATWSIADVSLGRRHHQQRLRRLAAPAAAAPAATSAAGALAAGQPAPGGSTASVKPPTDQPGPRPADSRDPLQTLAAPDERRRRLAAIRDRLARPDRNGHP